MGIVYLAALVVGAGAALLQLVLADHGGGHDVDGHPDDVSGAAIFLSARFWTYAALAFGMVGSLLTFLHLARSPATLTLALASGVSAGLFASLTFRALRSSSSSSSAALNDAVGQLARVLLPCAK